MICFFFRNTSASMGGCIMIDTHSHHPCVGDPWSQGAARAWRHHPVKISAGQLDNWTTGHVFFFDFSYWETHTHTHIYSWIWYDIWVYQVYLFFIPSRWGYLIFHFGFYHKYASRSWPIGTLEWLVHGYYPKYDGIRSWHFCWSHPFYMGLAGGFPK